MASASGNEILSNWDNSSMQDSEKIWEIYKNHLLEWIRVNEILKNYQARFWGWEAKAQRDEPGFLTDFRGVAGRQISFWQSCWTWEQELMSMVHVRVSAEKPSFDWDNKTKQNTTHLWIISIPEIGIMWFLRLQK